ncbi:Hypothetical predicted protein [Mytilus galloprovincialis]|uniref:Roc domain-containing protein n=1 Tax=Mytilus galloprovincialis TaxID=29158 RepID=A0A8B6EK69_MYTGA|nr:Hypothetical predicted protein [Mytilus galloprovincialis]
MPETIKQMSEDDRREFLKATKSGTQKRYNIRVLIVGENSVGKTCLLRRLLNEPIDDVQSTDGLDIERRKCQVDVETGEWHFSTSVKHPYSSWSGHNEQFADCGFWDFAGQKQFYATHQTFLNANAVYLLAVDISKEFTKQTHKEMIENTFDGIGEYTDFWLDNIHCYNTDVHDPSNKYNENPELNPPVIIVGTGMDNIPLVEREKRKQNYQDHLRKTLSVHAKRRHLRKAHFVSNTSPFDRGEEFCRLRKDIFNKARAFKNWGENLPSRWIVLEKEIYGQISLGKYTISYDEAIQLATDCSFPDLKVSNSELDAFLKYEHDIGNVIYFEDIKDFIVLDPKWLVDVFKCFVSNQYKNELIHMTEWCYNCVEMSVVKCFDCNKNMCKECICIMHNSASKDPMHLMQPLSDSYILNCKLRVKVLWLNDLKYLPNGLLVATTRTHGEELITFSVNEKQKQYIPLSGDSFRLAVKDENTVAVLTKILNKRPSVAIVDITQRRVIRYMNNTIIPLQSYSPFIFIENQLYFGVNSSVTVTDMSGNIQRRIKLSFTPYDIGYDVASRRIYFIDRDNCRLYCIDKDGNNIFTFTDPENKNFHSLTIDNNGNVLVLCTKRDHNSVCVMKVDSVGESSEVLITNIQGPIISCICFHHMTNSVVIAVNDTVNIYKRNEQVCSSDNYD